MIRKVTLCFGANRLRGSIKKIQQPSPVYDCTVEDVEYIYNKFSLYTELVIDV